MDKWLGYFMNVAEQTATLSHCKRKKVGAVIISDDLKNQLSFGYNGTPHGFDNDCECEKGITKSEVLHAESNAIAKIAKSTLSSKNSVLLVTLSPCIDCAKLIIQSEMRMVVYKEAYKDKSGLELLRKAGIEVIQFNNRLNK